MLYLTHKSLVLCRKVAKLSHQQKIVEKFRKQTHLLVYNL